jgi:hypothetical protein
LLDQSSLQRIPVHVSQFLDALFLSPHIEIIEAALPETILGNFVSGFTFPRLAKNPRPFDFAQGRPWGTRHASILTKYIGPSLCSG